MTGPGQYIFSLKSGKIIVAKAIVGYEASGAIHLLLASHLPDVVENASAVHRKHRPKNIGPSHPYHRKKKETEKKRAFRVTTAIMIQQSD